MAGADVLKVNPAERSALLTAKAETADTGGAPAFNPAAGPLKEI